LATGRPQGFREVAQFDKDSVGLGQPVREVPMRLPILSLFLISGVLLGEIQAASAQSPYSYPWCARSYKKDGGSSSCYYTSYQQCMTTLSGIGGYCFESPYYHPAKAAVQARRHRRT
jgi:Protein of unknown function (DUF3551)